MSSSLIVCNSELFLCWIVMCNEKWIFYDNWQIPAQRLNWEEAPKHFWNQNLYQKKIMVTGGLLLIWSTTAFWIPAKLLYLRSMLSKLMIRTENHSAYSWRWSTERTQFFSTTSNHMSHNQHFKSWMNWATKLCLICHIHLTSWQPTTTSSSNTTSWRQNASTTSRRQKMLSKSPLNTEAWIFTLRE